MMAYIHVARCPTSKGGMQPNFQGCKTQRSRKLETVDTLLLFYFYPATHPNEDKKLTTSERGQYRNNVQTLDWIR
jgi:hypothetical protein